MKLKTLKWKKIIAFDRFLRWFSRNEQGRIVTVFDIDYPSSDSDYPYRLLIDGTYSGDFKTLRDAKNYAQNSIL